MIPVKVISRPTLLSSKGIYDFIRQYFNWLEYESQDIPPRTYSDSVKLNFVISEMESLNNPAYSAAIIYLTNERDRLFCDPSQPLPLPVDSNASFGIIIAWQWWWWWFLLLVVFVSVVVVPGGCERW